MPCSGCTDCCRSFVIAMPMDADMARFYAYHGLSVRRQTPDVMHLCFSDVPCRHLTEDGRCAIYERRPSICRRYSCYEAAYGEPKPEETPT